MIWAALAGVIVAMIIGVVLVVIAVLFTWKIFLSAGILWLARHEMFFDEIPEGFSTAYESGGKFFALACSYKDFGPVKAPGDLDWAIRRVGDKDLWSEWTDERGTTYPSGEHVYTADDFQWNRRPWLVKKVFGEEAGIVWMGIWPAVKPRYYKLRLSNFRTVKPSDGEVQEKNASLRIYTVGEGQDKQQAGWLVSWNELTKRVILSDDIYPIPVDNVRIGTRISGTGSPKPQAVTANILVFIRARIQQPYLFLYRVEDTLETIQNELIQHVRQLCAGLSIQDAFALKATLQSDRAGQENLILQQNDFGNYMRSRYGFSAKGTSFAYIDIVGDAGKALAAPYIAQQNADAVVIQGIGEGKAESERLTLEGNAYRTVIDTIGPEGAALLRGADVAGQFATGGKSNTFVLGNILDAVKDSIGGSKKGGSGEKKH
ncbi:MAG: hypothetical protein ABSE18_00440 [Minisyncoccia bacterium]|jgi:hypothetical protein